MTINCRGPRYLISADWPLDGEKSFSQDSFGFVLISDKYVIEQIKKEKVLKQLNLSNENLE
jgi:hypothetical protein